jgi:membrane associated rhomboid family serine protease/Flp pilus assembly protein TadD
MPICPQCGNKFSGFSFGSNPAGECKNCRKARAAAESANMPPGNPPAVAAANTRQLTPVVTLTLIGLNVLIYVAMGLSGVSWTDPSVEHAIRWGADFGPLTLGGEWWRIFTSTFVHFGILHIGLNMWCLWNLGSSLEIFMGRKAFAVTYLLSGLMASLTSIAWNPWRVSAGASGAIFGTAGAFVSYLYLKKVPIDRAVVKQRLKSLAIFIGYNLLYGAAGNVDNSAHLGGLISGLALGVLVPPMLRGVDSASQAAAAAAPPSVEEVARQESYANRVAWQIPMGGVIVLLIAATWIRARNLPAANYGKAVAYVESGQLNRGVDEMQQAVALDSNLVLPQALLGELRLEQGNPSAAIPVLEHTLSLVPNTYDVEHNLALAYLGSGRPTEAISEITTALKYEKTDPWRAQYILGSAAEQAGNSQLAAENLRLVVQSKPDFQEAREALARLGSASKPASAFAIPYSKLALKSEAWPLFP